MNVPIYNFKNEVVKVFKSTINPIESKSNIDTPSVGHSIDIIDGSGSMYNSMDTLKDALIRKATIDDFKGVNLKHTIISYSSQGDVIIHFSRVDTNELCELNSVHLQAIQKIKVRGLTCISQALEVAQQFIEPSELTGITLHSDGYANDPSSTAEKHRLRDICMTLRKYPLFMNTIAYSEYADFNLLSELANLCSGTCTHVKTASQLYDAFYSSTAVISQAGPSVEMKNSGNQILIFQGNNPYRFIGSDGNLTIRSVKDGIGYSFEEVNETPNVVSDPKIYYIMSRYFISVGQLNMAKYALFSSGNSTLFHRHYKALTPNQIGEFATDMDIAIQHISGNGLQYNYESRENLIPNIPTVLDILNTIDKYRDSIKINMPKFNKSYHNISVKRVIGVRQNDGSIIEPEVDTEYVDQTEYNSVDYFEYNHSKATVNMHMSNHVTLVNRKTRAVIKEVAGITLNNLKSYKNYTLVSNGEVYSNILPMKFEKKTSFDAFQKLGAVVGEYEPSKMYEVSLDRPICNLDANFGQIQSAIEQAMLIKIIKGMLNAVTKESSAEYTVTQIEELGKHCLSKSLYLNFPTTTPYTNLDEAIQSGLIDKRTNYTIALGTTEILNMDKFRSANDLFKRYYSTETEKDPKLSVILEGVKLNAKTLSTRAKETSADKLHKEILDSFINESRVTKTKLEKICRKADCMELIQGIIKLTGNERLITIEEVRAKINKFERSTWDELTPLVFYIGSTGLIPEELNAEMLTVDELTQKYPELNLSKTEKEGTFFRVDNIIISVFTEESYFTPS